MHCVCLRVRGAKCAQRGRTIDDPAPPSLRSGRSDCNRLLIQPRVLVRPGRRRQAGGSPRALANRLRARAGRPIEAPLGTIKARASVRVVVLTPRRQGRSRARSRARGGRPHLSFCNHNRDELTRWIVALRRRKRIASPWVEIPSASCTRFGATKQFTIDDGAHILRQLRSDRCQPLRLASRATDLPGLSSGQETLSPVSRSMLLPCRRRRSHPG
jgi:hypothetical protein